MQMNNLDSYIYTTLKVTQSGTKNRRKHSHNLCDLKLGNGFLGMTPKHEWQKKKIDKLSLIKKAFLNCASNNIVKEVKKTTYTVIENVYLTYLIRDLFLACANIYNSTI